MSTHNRRLARIVGHTRAGGLDTSTTTCTCRCHTACGGAGSGGPVTAAAKPSFAAAAAAPAASESTVRIKAGPFEFTARLEEELAPQTCALFRALLPHTDKMIQAKWSGFAAWIPSPLGPKAKLPVLPPENATMVPLPGQLLFYPGGISEVEILFPYGPTVFASVAGSLAGNHFLTITEGLEHLSALGQGVQWEGAQSISFELLL
eukprot:SAG22_NODE_3590_length_1629_cov_1.742484_2_plen_205_part_00